MIKQIGLVLLHLDMYRNSHNYFFFPKTESVPSSEFYNGEPTHKRECVDKEYGEAQIGEFIRLEQKHYDKF